MWPRALAFWSHILVFAFANGALREGVLVPAWGVRTGQAASVVILSTVVLVMARLFVRRAGVARDRDALAVGLAWLALTLAFEFGFGRARGVPWQTLLHDYDVSAGRIWPVVLACTFLGPFIALRFVRRPSGDVRGATTRRALVGLLALVAMNAVGGGLRSLSP
jgi:heme/copper-type cytochrome/quinol oxidase subunit 3